MNKQQFLDFLDAADFAALFNEAGWNRPASNRPYRYEIGPEKKPFVFKEAAFGDPDINRTFVFCLLGAAAEHGGCRKDCEQCFFHP